MGTIVICFSSSPAHHRCLPISHDIRAQQILRFLSKKIKNKKKSWDSFPADFKMPVLTLINFTSFFFFAILEKQKNKEINKSFFSPLSIMTAYLSPMDGPHKVPSWQAHNLTSLVEWASFLSHELMNYSDVSAPTRAMPNKSIWLHQAYLEKSQERNK